LALSDTDETFRSDWESAPGPRREPRNKDDHSRPHRQAHRYASTSAGRLVHRWDCGRRRCVQFANRSRRVGHRGVRQMHGTTTQGRPAGDLAHVLLHQLGRNCHPGRWLHELSRGPPGLRNGDRHAARADASSRNPARTAGISGFSGSSGSHIARIQLGIAAGQ
jgi:hypothetical protein